MGSDSPRGDRQEHRPRSQAGRHHQQYVQQRQLQQQAQMQARWTRPCARDLPDKQQQTRHNPVTEVVFQRGGFSSDQ
jgi:hypothetical protein